MAQAPRQHGRYDRQIVFEPLGPQGQRRLRSAGALIVGCGGLGCTLADLLARSGVGRLRLVDDDRVQLENLHRQVLFDEADAAAGLPKVAAAANRLRRINGEVAVEPLVERFTAASAARLAEGFDLILDASDNFPTRFVINDLAVRDGKSWVFAGVLGGQGQVMSVLPGRPCLRCVFDSPPAPCQDLTCRSSGVLPSAVAAIAAIQAGEAVKILSGRLEAVSPYLLKIDFWANTLQRIDILESAARVDCPCCKRREFEYLS